MKWNNNKSELKETRKLMKKELKKLASITPATRSVFLTMLERSENNVILLDEVKDILNLSNENMKKHLDILIKHGLIYEPEESHEYRGYVSEFKQVEGWPMWDDIKVYCEKKQVDLRSMVYDMDFNLLD